MIRRRVDSGREQRLLIAMATSTPFISQVEASLDLDLLEQGVFKIVAGWCLDYFREYKKAPSHHVTDIFHHWSEKNDDQDLVDRVKDFLEVLGRQYESEEEPPNLTYLTDQLRDFLAKRKLIQLKDSLEYALLRGDTDEAEQAVTSYRKSEVGAFGINPLKDNPPWEAAFAEPMKPIIVYGGDAGTFFNPVLTRDALVGIQAPEKTGKSAICLDIIHQALRQRRKVALFHVGDLSEAQVLLRLGVRWAQRPLWRRQCGKIKVPRKIEFDDAEDLGYSFRYSTRHCPKVLTLKAAKRGRDVFARACGHNPNRTYLRLSTHPSGTINVAGVSAILNQWEQTFDFSPDVCVAGGSLVLTNKGLIPIENVSCDLRLWDGEQWVAHDGPIFKGWREVISYAGITATPDHQVLSESGWRTLESCKRMGLRVAQTEEGGRALGVGKSYIPYSTSARDQVTLSRQISESTRVCICRMCSLQTHQMDSLQEPSLGSRWGLSSMPTTRTVSSLALQSHDGGQVEVREPQGSSMEELWRKRNQIQVSECIRCLRMGVVEPAYFSRQGDRPNRQRWPLRTWEYPLFDTSAEHIAHKEASKSSTDASLSSTVPTHYVCRCHSKSTIQDNDNEASRRQVEESHNETPIWAPVWDILNAGPLHRFTVQGVLSHNCVVDYSDILAPENARLEPRHRTNETWAALRRLSQERHCLVITPTQANASTYKQDSEDADRLQTMKSFSEDKRKYAHVTAMLGLNQTWKEKEIGGMRLNWLVVRESEYVSGIPLYIGTCFALGKVICCASFRR